MDHQIDTIGQAVGGHVARVVVSADRIAQRVSILAEQIDRTYHGRELTIVAVMTGALVFLADLVRRLNLMVRVEVASVRSYPDGATRSGPARFRLPPAEGIAGKDVLVLDDILDSGATITLLMDTVASMSPASLRSCVLMRKSRPELTHRIGVDFAGFDIEDEFVVGYGLDFDNLYRNLPDICVLKRHILSSGAEDEV